MAGTPTSARFSGYAADKSEAGMHPAKLFIGGITRHTTTKQLRDHFSRYGRVLDCVAMRQPDGRPRGFGYVTLDSMAAADRCLAEKQVVDGRVVDMKRAVPEGSGSPAGAAAGGMLDYGHTPDSCLGAPLRVPPPPASLYGEWPDASAMGLGTSPYFGMIPAYEQHVGTAATSPMAGGEQLWGCYTPQTPDTSGDAPDCVELLSRRGMLQPQHRLEPARGDATRLMAGAGHVASRLDGQSLATTPCPTPKVAPLSPSAPEFTPMGSQGLAEADPGSEEKTVAPEPQARPALGEITNLVKGCRQDATMQPPSEKGGLLRGRAADLVASGLGGLENVQVSTPTGKVASSLGVVDDPCLAEDVEGPAGVAAAEEKGDDEEMEVDQEGIAAALEPPAGDFGAVELHNEDELPSKGSAEHASGNCRRCNFFPKGRCQNGKDCTFCHLPHDKRKPSRQEKRERRAAWLAQHQDQHGLTLDDFDEEDDDNSEDNEQQVMAYSVLPGMPPIRATKLPPPLALPGCGYEVAPSPTGYPRPPPGLAPPQPWQPEEEISPQQQYQMYGPYGSPIHALGPVVPPSKIQILATVPAPPSATPSPVGASAAEAGAAPRADVLSPAAAGAAARSGHSSPTSCTIGTQTEEDGDGDGPAEEADLGEADAPRGGAKARHRRIWPRGELLQLRGLGSEPLAVGAGGSAAPVLFRTAPRGDAGEGRAP